MHTVKFTAIQMGIYMLSMLNRPSYEPLSATNPSKASALSAILGLLVAHDNFLTVNEQVLPEKPDVRNRQNANIAIEKLITELLEGRPVDKKFATTLHPRLNTLVEWAKSNPTLVPKNEFAEILGSAVAFAGQIEAFAPVTPKLSERQH
jgi:hypothetical protein